MNRKEGAHVRYSLRTIRTFLLRLVVILPLLILLDRGLTWAVPLFVDKPKTCKIPRTTVEKFFAEVFQ